MNTVIYGHNMRHDDKIFGTLEQYREIDGFKNAPIITMHTLYGEHKFKIYAVFIVKINSGCVINCHWGIYGSIIEITINIIVRIVERNSHNLLIVMTAINHIDYANGKEHDLEGMELLAFRFLKGSIDRNEKLSAIRAEAGSKGGKQTQANASKNKQAQANSSKNKQNAINNNNNVNNDKDK